MTRSLAGKRIVVTRADHQRGRLADALEEKGAEVISIATIAIVPPSSFADLDWSIQNLSSFDFLILTSANGVRSLAERVQACDVSWRTFEHLQIACIGPATSAAVSRLGLSVGFTPEEYIAESVVSMLATRVAGKSVLLVRGALGRDVIPSALAERGARVKVVEAYRTILPEESVPRVREVLAGRELPDAVTFTSSSTVENFFSLVKTAGVELPPGLRAVSIGPVTSRTLREHNWKPAAQAAVADIPGLVAACELLFTSRS
jgi:uroporphyrinogen-III synthase